MKALTLWQPWATLIALGVKTVETRDWWTRYRGELAIHAAKRPVRPDELTPEIRGALRAAVAAGHLAPAAPLPYGAVVATCRLTDCRPTDLLDPDPFGNYDAGRWGFGTWDGRPAAVPAPCGSRGTSRGSAVSPAWVEQLELL